MDVVSGVMTFVVAERRFEASSGELVWLPPEKPYTFANLGDEPVRACAVTTPAGLEGRFEEQAGTANQSTPHRGARRPSLVPIPRSLRLEVGPRGQAVEHH